MSKCVAVVLPCYKVREHILDVISRIGSEVAHIYVVDDCCPDQSGAYVEENCTDPRVRLVFNQVNLGVGGAVMAGYREAIKDGADIIVKIDGDGQMDPALLPKIIFPLLKGKADYAKGNRFYDLAHIRRMPTVRLIGNAGLSLISKLSTGYWQTFDPTNGYTAIDARVADHLPFDRISQRYFFETDMLFRLNTLRAVVADVPMDACYGEEVSNLKIKDIIGEFFSKNMRNFFKRIFYNYFLRDMSLASLELLAGTALLSFGLVFGVVHWYSGFLSGQVTPTGTIMIASLSLLSGLQFMLAFFSYDIAATPTQPIGDLLLKRVHR
ncbi:glycosyltransferase family 2 protein [Aquipseudomonas alcaligenes]|uniref:glycosyltransferase family 2 protein n=1 Tax=Aquipseudomonas alcaligenes TaxID=43263 RepID=UPI0024321A8E|nr:glycosyltransferase family 2 protein [Pseudomonas alcaligenes]